MTTLVHDKTQEAHGQHEVAVFREFLAVAGPTLAVQDFRKACPPLPDLVCTMYDSLSMGFELVRLDDPHVREGLNRERQIREMLHKELSKSSASVIKARFSNHVIWVKLRDSLSLPKAQTACQRLMQFLADLSDNAPNVFHTPVSDVEDLEYVEVSQNSFPRFEMQLLPRAYLISASVDKHILKKETKIYRCGFPVDLLAYDEISPSFLYCYSESDVEKELTAIKLDHFNQVWLFDRTKKSIFRYVPSTGKCNQVISQGGNSHS